MKKIIFRKFLTDCLIFFLITLVSTSIIIWIFQAVNYLDIIIDDGRSYNIYLNYALLNFPKIISKILPFAFFFSFTYVIAKYELNNQLLIYWNFGINKFSFVNFFLLFSIFLFLIQIIFTAFIVPKSQSLARTIIRTSSYDFSQNLLKAKKFNAATNGLTIYAQDKDKNGNLKNIYIKRDSGKNNFQITYAKKGVFINNNDGVILELYDGENTNLINNKITNFSFSKSEFNISSFAINKNIPTKTQEHMSSELFECSYILVNKSLNQKNKALQKIKEKIKNCELKNLDNILAELYKRLIVPLYIILLMLVSLLLIVPSKENINYTKYRLSIFLVGFFLIIFSESTLKFISSVYYKNLIVISIPLILIFSLYIYFFLKFNYRYKLK